MPQYKDNLTVYEASPQEEIYTNSTLQQATQNLQTALESNMDLNIKSAKLCMYPPARNP